MILIILSILLLLDTAISVVGEVDPWSFIVLADWHGAEAFTVKPGQAEYDENYSGARTVFQNIHAKHSPDLMILPGDIQTGHWYTSEFREYLATELSMTNLTTSETVHIAAENCYNTTRTLLHESGFSKFLFAFGDHEIGKYDS